MKGRKTLEINPEHPIVQALKEKVESDPAAPRYASKPVEIERPSVIAAGTEAVPNQ